jgi:restriction system protein
METRIGDMEVSYTSRGTRTYRLELWHDGLKKHRVISGNDAAIVERKARLQAHDWAERWVMAKNREALRQERTQKKEYQESQKALAAERTAEAQAALAALENILAHTLGVNDAIDWDSLKDRTHFSEPAPKLEPASNPPLAEPDPARYEADITFLDRLLSSRRERKIADAARSYEAARAAWQKQVDRRTEEQRNREEQLAADVLEWQRRRDAFLSIQADSNAAVDRKLEAYEARDPEAILDYCDLVLSNSEYPEWMPKEWDLDYNPETGILVAEYSLPSLDQIPRMSEVRYAQTRDELSEKVLPDGQLRTLYDTVIYQIVLRTVHELFEADSVGALEAVVFNGRVTSVDPRTGHETTACILSLQAPKTEFLAINLAQVDPKACFKSLKGVGSSKLHSLTPVAPIVQMRRDDGRFVSAREVASTLDDSFNLAAMDWEDFEHLIRELFEREFTASGGEVKVTQASRDGGVDAIAFDPDPIRGGKIVIQAKRYTNTVGVAAVRDLYGTVMNEGATKGILVTTSDYGPEAYAFAKDKPLTLLNGANLLHLLGKHGTRAKIDIQEARRLMGV